jgi:hypothetical protein
LQWYSLCARCHQWKGGSSSIIMILPLYWLCNATPSHIQQLHSPKLFKEKSVLWSACGSKV